jgi:hypothetical protein
MSSNRNSITHPKTFAEQVGQVAMDAHTSASIAQVAHDELYGQFLLSQFSRAGLRVVRVTDANIGPDDITVELPSFDLPLAVRVRQAMDLDTTLELAPTGELPALLRDQAE